jgi:hypothetical protein
MTDEATITALIRRWAAAVHAGDLDAVLADRAPDIVMFDVAPPDDGVRGLAAHRETQGVSAGGSAAAVLRLAAHRGVVRDHRPGRHRGRRRRLRPRAAAVRHSRGPASTPTTACG